MKIKTLLLAQLSSILLFTSLNAEECIDIKSVNVGWTSYKTMAKIAVSGTFDNVKIIRSEDTSDINTSLIGTSVVLNMLRINANSAEKTNNILRFFLPKLSTRGIHATITRVNDRSLALEVLLNGRKQLIPMKYTMENGVIQATGFIDARDFGIDNALRNLNKSISAHRNKGWLDIAISFELIYEDKCHVLILENIQDNNLSELNTSDTQDNNLSELNTTNTPKNILESTADTNLSELNVSKD